MKVIKALHVASFNGNVGDNASHNGFRKRLIDSLGCSIHFNEVEIREFYESWDMGNLNMDDFIAQCNSYDLVIFSGGNFF